MRAGLTMAVVAALVLGGASPEGNAEKYKPESVAPPTVLISPTSGFVVKPCAGADCVDGKRVVAKKGGFDYAGLRTVLVKLRARYGKVPGLTVVPPPQTPWHVVVKTVATARKTADGKPLFPVVYLAVSGG